MGTTIGVIKGDTRSLDYNSYILKTACYFPRQQGQRKGRVGLLSYSGRSLYINVPIKLLGSSKLPDRRSDVEGSPKEPQLRQAATCTGRYECSEFRA